MSAPAKIVLASAVTFSLSIVGYVHYRQYYDREQLHIGVVKDLERQQMRKIENLYNLQKQIDFTKELKKDEDKLIQ